MKIFNFLIESKIYISLAAILLALETQIQLGLNPRFYPYLMIIFFATLIEYNLFRLNIVLFDRTKLNIEKNEWLSNNINLYFIMLALSLLGLIFFAFEANNLVLIILLPLSIITLLYSFPFIKNNKLKLLRLREIPYLKIFLISLVWSLTTVILPAVKSSLLIKPLHLFVITIERFFFVFAITIPFDIRDVKEDIASGLKTLPIKFNSEVAIKLSNIAIVLFIFISAIEFMFTNQIYIFIALLISGITTYTGINNQNLIKNKYYHYGILDGTMILQFLFIFFAKLI